MPRKPDGGAGGNPAGDDPAPSTRESLNASPCMRQERRGVKLDRDVAVLEDDEERALREKLQQHPMRKRIVWRREDVQKNECRAGRPERKARRAREGVIRVQVRRLHLHQVHRAAGAVVAAGPGGGGSVAVSLL